MIGNANFVSQNGYRKVWCFMKTLDYIILVLIIVGALNWGLIGFFQFDLVRVIIGNMSMISRNVYAHVGLSGLNANRYLGRNRSAK